MLVGHPPLERKHKGLRYKSSRPFWEPGFILGRAVVRSAAVLAVGGDSLEEGRDWRRGDHRRLSC